MYSKDHTINVFIDYKKAFDTVNYTILTVKFEKYGVRGLPLNLIKNYLCDRYQTGKVNRCFSPPKKFNIGRELINSGTNLFFLIYINDLPNISVADRWQHSMCILWTIYTSLSCSSQKNTTFFIKSYFMSILIMADKKITEKKFFTSI